MTRALIIAVALVAAAALFAVLLLRAPHPASPSPVVAAPARISAPWFQDVTDDVGVDFLHVAARAEEFFMPASTGSGMAVFDFDNDGRLDLYLVQNGGPQSTATNRLYRQTAEGRFVDATRGSGLDLTGYGMGVAAADVTNDGWTDLLVTEYGRTRLFINRGNGTFADVTEAAGLDNPSWGMSAAFFDYDRDGWLDLVVVNYVDYDPAVLCDDQSGRRDFCGPNSFAGTVTRLFHNRGLVSGAAQPTPRFDDVTVAAGLAALKGPALGVYCADLTGDHWPDILVANDGAANHLWVNQRDGTFREEAVLRGIGYDGFGRYQANMGIAVGDVDGDGLNDIFMSHLHTELHVCWKQDSPGYFQDATASMGLATPAWRSTGFGALFADFDLDGAVDLVLVNGRVRRREEIPREAGRPDWFWSAYVDRNQLFANDGTGRFRDLSPENAALCASFGVGRGLACGDLDGDGAMDLVETRIADRARIFRNVAPKRGHWLEIRAVDPTLGGRDAIGAEITVRAGGRRWIGAVNPGFSYLCSNSPWAHFGLGPVASVEAIEVRWPDGSLEEFPGGPVNRLMVLRKSAGPR